ncbi:hypothetical protein ACMYSQ_001122 [Aspergillus niger]
MEADGGWGVMDDLLSQRTALQCADPASQQPAPRYREAPMGLFLAQRTARKGPADAWDYSSDGQRRRRPVEANRPGGPRSFQDSLGFAGYSLLSQPFIPIHFIHPSIFLFGFLTLQSLVPFLFCFTPSGLTAIEFGSSCCCVGRMRTRFPFGTRQKVSFSLCLSFPLIQAPKLVSGSIS